MFVRPSLKMLAEETSYQLAIKNISPQKLDSIVNEVAKGIENTTYLSSPVIKCKKTPRKKCSFVAEEAKKR